MKYLTFEDVLISPGVSDIESRKDVDISSNIGSFKLNIPAISANMDTVTGPEMASAMANNGALGVLHRFCTIDHNVEMYKKATQNKELVASSVGIDYKETERARALYNQGCRIFFIDVAHGASTYVVEQYKRLMDQFSPEDGSWEESDAHLIVGNFAGADQINWFSNKCGFSQPSKFIGAFKVGIGPSPVCSTRGMTGVGVPQLSAILDCATTGATIIADGGIKKAGDMCKALAAGASAVMCGSLFAGTAEAEGAITEETYYGNYKYPITKVYRGSASRDSYEVQDKVAPWRAAEGISTTVPFKGPVKNVLQELEGGLRSSFTYVGARNMQEYQEKVKFIEITNSGIKESKTYEQRTT